MKSLIFGYGETGKSFERYLNNKEKDFEIFDANISKFNFKYNPKDYDQILCSPGIARNTFYELKKNNKNVLTDLDIFFNEDKSIKIGITGTNRKSTTAYHLHQIFETYEKTNLIGNIGNTMLDNINNGKKFSIIELSSFQLDKMIENRLDFGILLNIESDHLDYHKDIESYKHAKERILAAKKSIAYELDPYKLFDWITNKKSKKIRLNDLPYRLERISRNIINDSKSTNYHSLLYAIEKAKDCFNDNFILIVCGNPQKEQYRKFRITEPSEILIFGKHSEAINKCIEHNNKKIFNDIEDLFLYLNNNKNESNLLFSPGYPSGDDFKNFIKRGEIFNLHALQN